MNQVSARVLPLALAISTLAVVLVGGCGSGDRMTTGPTDNGLSTHTVESAGFSLGVPRHWDVVRRDDAADVLDDMVADDPSLELFVEQLRSPDSPFKLLAIAPTRDRDAGVAPTLTVAEAPLPADTTALEYLEAGRPQLEASVELLDDIAIEPVEHPSEDAAVARYAAQGMTGESPNIAAAVYVIASGDKAFVLSFTMAEQLEPDYRAQFDNSALSFRFL